MKIEADRPGQPMAKEIWLEWEHRNGCEAITVSIRSAREGAQQWRCASGRRPHRREGVERF